MNTDPNWQPNQAPEMQPTPDMMVAQLIHVLSHILSEIDPNKDIDLMYNQQLDADGLAKFKTAMLERFGVEWRGPK